MKKLVMGLIFFGLAFTFQNCSKIELSDLRKIETLKAERVFQTPGDPVVAAVNVLVYPEVVAPVKSQPAAPVGLPDVIKPGQSIRFLLSCPEPLDDKGQGKTSLSSQSSKDLKVVLLQKKSTGSEVICEVDNVRPQLFSTERSVDISKCGTINTSQGQVTVYLVDEDVTANFEEKKYNNNMNIYRPGNSGLGIPMSVAFAEFGDPRYQDSKYNVKCDGLGDPLLVQIGGARAKKIELSSIEDGVFFDLLGEKNNHEKVKTAWFANSNSDNYFIVLPKSTGTVTGIDELFGDNTKGPDSQFSKMGFDALEKYDTNHDKKIDQKDSIFSDLRLWKDDNLDGIVQQSELHTLSEMKVKAIDLNYDHKYREQDQYGNTVKFKSVIIMEDNSYGLVYDLWLRYTIQR